MNDGSHIMTETTISQSSAVDSAPNAASEIAEAPLSLQQRLLATLFTSQSIFNAATTVSFTVLPIAAVAITNNESLAGLPSTVTLIARTVVALPIGWLMDRVGRRLGISFGLAASVLGLLLTAYGIIWGSFGVFLVGAFINGLGRGTGEQSRYAAADIVPPARASNAIATVVFAGTIGSVLGPFLNTPAQAFSERLGLAPLSGPYFLAAALAAVALVMTFIMLRPDPSTLSQRREAQAPANSHVKKSIRELFSSSSVQLAVVALAISQLVMSMIMIITPLHMTHQNHTGREIEWVIAVHILGMFALSNVTGKLVVRYGAYFMIAMAGLVLGTAAILAPFAQSVWMLGLALFLLGLGWNFGFVSGSALLANSFTGPDKGQAQGTAETFVAAAAAVGSFTIGPSFQWGGYLAVAMIGLAFVLAMMGTLFWQRRTAARVPLA